MNHQLVTLVASGMVLASCASIVEGTDQSIAVNLSPENASCRVIRQGSQVASISRTNRFLNLSKSKYDLIIECQAKGYLDDSISIESSASGWGVVGCFLIDLCITDYATGALNKYPKTINIALTPTTFESEESRNRWYETRRKSIENRWNKLISRKSAECEGTEQGSACRVDLAATRNKKTEELRKLETRSASAQTSKPASESGTFSARLAELKSLFDSGMITREEYDAKRRKILSEI
jgi:Short C-terminal domain